MRAARKRKTVSLATTCATTHGPAEGDDVALWYAQQVLASADAFDHDAVAAACEAVLDHPQATYADLEQAHCLLEDLTGRAA